MNFQRLVTTYELIDMDSDASKDNNQIVYIEGKQRKTIDF
jgi:hypothetical protein